MQIVALIIKFICKKDFAWIFLFKISQITNISAGGLFIVGNK